MVSTGEEQYQAYLERREREAAEHQARYEAEARARREEREEAAGLLRKLGAAYTEYTHFVAAHPQAGPAAEGDPADDQAFYEKLRRNLGHADDAPRCTHIKADGIRCGSPRMKTGLLCYSHQRMTEARPGRFRMAAIDDANGIQLALMQVCRALVDGNLTHALAGKLLYALQTAASNVERVTFHETPGDMVLEVTEPAPEPAASDSVPQEPPPSHGMVPYELIDDDLMRQLSAIGDEVDRRARVRAGHEPPVIVAQDAAPYIDPKTEAHPALAIGPAVSSGDAIPETSSQEAPGAAEAHEKIPLTSSANVLACASTLAGSCEAP